MNATRPKMPPMPETIEDPNLPLCATPKRLLNEMVRYAEAGIAAHDTGTEPLEVYLRERLAQIAQAITIEHDTARSLGAEDGVRAGIEFVLRSIEAHAAKPKATWRSDLIGIAAAGIAQALREAITPQMIKKVVKTIMDEEGAGA